MARSLARTRVTCSAPGQRWGRCRVRRHAEPEGLGGCQSLAQTDARCPAGQIMRHHLYRQPGPVGGEAARGEMVEFHAVFEVSDGILDLGVAAMVGLQLQGIPVPVGDEAVIAVAGK